MLLVYGERDERVPPAESRVAIERALSEGKNAPVTTRIFTGADHTFRVHLPGDVWPRSAPGYPQAILDWVRSVTEP